MIIRKSFKIETSHIVRNCSTDRCKNSIHGHSSLIEVLLESKYLDNGQMIIDFSLLKPYIGQIIDSFDHCIVFWDKDNSEYIEYIKKFSNRWISLPVSPSAEQLSRILFMLCMVILNKTKFNNGENSIIVNSVIYHETSTGYAQSFLSDITPTAHKINYDNVVEYVRLNILPYIEFSPQIKSEWNDPLMIDKVLNSKIEEICFENPIIELQVK
jgi:6-pyruvoyltetrahydropterin/6-carboxytetrahydropterin synthase